MSHTHTVTVSMHSAWQINGYFESSFTRNMVFSITYYLPYDCPSIYALEYRIVWHSLILQALKSLEIILRCNQTSSASAMFSLLTFVGSRDVFARKSCDMIVLLFAK